jgi:DNA polymerase-1
MLHKIVGAKQAQKKANTYYKNYLAMVDDNDVIHCSLGQETTVTGRLSGFAPNLQNVHKEKYHEYAVRNAFIAPPDYDFFFFDYSAQEMVIMIDLSGDLDVIEKVKGGLDIYLAMAEIVQKYTGIKLTRSQAKALALGVAYGQGIALIASNLKCSELEAKKLRGAFKSSLKGVTKLDAWCKEQAKRYGKIHNPYGRVSLIEKGFEYKTLNALIQGTAADCTKTAYVNCTKFLADYKSNVVLQVHDELCYYIHQDERFLISKLKKIMSEAYPYRHLPLSVDVEFSETSWGAKVDYEY